MFDFKNWEYCSVITYRTVAPDGTVRKSTFIKFPQDPVFHKRRNATNALSELKKVNWELVSVASNVHPDGTVQLKFYLKRSILALSKSRL